MLFSIVFAAILRGAQERAPQDDGGVVGRINAPYALAMSGNTASILVFKVAALNGLTM
jgi:hypothetical protein